MSILKNLFAAVGAVTLGAVAVGVVLGATTAMTADGDDFDLDELRDDAPCGGCRKCAEKNGEKKASDADAEKVKEKPAEKVEENPTKKAEEPETSAEAEEDKAEKQ